AARQLDALHVARVVELIVEPVREPDRPPRIGREIAAQVPREAIGVQCEGVLVLRYGGSHAESRHYGDLDSPQSTTRRERRTGTILLRTGEQRLRTSRRR